MANRLAEETSPYLLQHKDNPVDWRPWGPEALRAATLGGAQALRRTDIGHLRVGAAADIVLLDAPSYVHLAYRPGVPLVHRVIASSTE